MVMSTAFKYVGKRIPTVDGWERATGRAEYVTDIKLPGMLYGKILRSPHPHARILHIDVSKAESLPGVKAVATFADTPRVPFGPITAFEDWYIFAKDRVRFIGEEVAAVAGRSGVDLDDDVVDRRVHSSACL